MFIYANTSIWPYSVHRNTHTHSLTHTHTYIQLTPWLTHISITHNLTHSQSHSLTQNLFHSLMLTHAHSHTLPHIHTRTLTYSHSHSSSLTHKHSHLPQHYFTPPPPPLLSTASSKQFELGRGKRPRRLQPLQVNGSEISSLAAMPVCKATRKRGLLPTSTSLRLMPQNGTANWVR